MGKKRFTEEQIAFALRQHDGGTTVAEIIRKLGVSERPFGSLQSLRATSESNGLKKMSASAPADSVFVYIVRCADDSL